MEEALAVTILVMAPFLSGVPLRSDFRNTRQPSQRKFS